MIVLFLLGKATTAVFSVDINDIGVALEVTPIDWSEEMVEEGDSLEDDEVLCYDHSHHQEKVPSPFEMSFRFPTTLENHMEVIVPPPQS